MLRPLDAVLVVVDVQNRLLPQIHRGPEVVAQILRLIRGFQIVEAPILVTEQYRRGLGSTHPAIQQALADPLPEHERMPAAALPDEDPHVAIAGFDPIEKISFSCADHPAFLEELAALDRAQVVLCGVEAHVCVLQTALQLVERGYEVVAVADAISSRRLENAEIALRRMERAGVLPETVESAVFQMLGECGTPEFKRWLEVIR